MKWNAILVCVALSLLFEFGYALRRLNAGLKDLPRDCSEIAEEAVSHSSPQSGVYLIDPDGRGAFDAFCRFRSRRGYTVFQRRMNGEEDFNRTWGEYALGFGELDRDYWLGLEHVHRLTQNAYRCMGSELHVMLRSFNGQIFNAKYSYFKVLGHSQNYKLFASGYEGDAGDPFEKPSGQSRFSGNEMEFSTCDKDNDKDPIRHCAQKYSCGWWYNKCFSANLNGAYQGHKNDSDWEGIIWSPAGGRSSFEWTEMSVLTRGE